jgi:hypothetical protein
LATKSGITGAAKPGNMGRKMAGRKMGKGIDISARQVSALPTGYGVEGNLFWS